MPDSLDLTADDISTAINKAGELSRPLSLAYVGADGKPRLSVRGSTHVHSSSQLAIWSRSKENGLVTTIPSSPEVVLMYLGAMELPPPWIINITGTARVDASVNDEVYEQISQAEKDHDPDRNGVAVIIDVQDLTGFGPDGMIQQSAGA